MKLPESIYFIGACGRAMSNVMLEIARKGVKVSGSDNEFTYGKVTKILAENNILVHYGFKAENLFNQPQLVVIGRGHIRGNPEVEYVLDNNIPYLSLPEFLSFYFFNGAKNILITGSKGKTTTTCMVTTILEHEGLNPGYLIGGVPVSGIQAAKLGSKLNVIEADDFSSLWWNDAPKSLYYRPTVVILTNSYRDHPEHQINDQVRVRHITALIEQIPSNGLLIVIDCQNKTDLDIIKKYAKCAVKTINTLSPSDETFSNYTFSNEGSVFEWQGEKVKLSLNGEMNSRNAIAALMVSEYLSIPVSKSAKALNGFKGVHGRLEHVVKGNGINFYTDNYGYLPESLIQNFNALEERHPKSRKVIVCQILIIDGIEESQKLLQEALSLWDKVFLTIYQPTVGIMPKINPEYLLNLEKLLKENKCDATYINKFQENKIFFVNELRNDDVVFFLIHPREDDKANQLIQEILAHENFNH